MNTDHNEESAVRDNEAAEDCHSVRISAIRDFRILNFVSFDNASGRVQEG